jgi:hypothetical protein
VIWAIDQVSFADKTASLSVDIRVVQRRRVHRFSWRWSEKQLFIAAGKNFVGSDFSSSFKGILIGHRSRLVPCNPISKSARKSGSDHFARKPAESRSE